MGGGTAGGGVAGSGGSGGTAGGGGSAADAGLGDGVACALDVDCTGRFCGPQPDGGKACSSPCTDATACGGSEFFRCAADDGGTRRCWPRLTTQCRPCQTDTDCRSDVRDLNSDARCLGSTDLSRGSFCAVSCAAQSCPLGYTCEVGSRGPLCVKSVGECACSAAFEGASTACTQRNGIGSCVGSRRCTSGSLTSCSARVPALEQCNGMDDDCDGPVDENTAASCDDGLSCTTDSCGGDAGCLHAVPGDECAVDGGCWPVGTVDPAGACATCQPSVRKDAFSPVSGCSVDGTCYPPDAGNPLTSCEVCDPARSTSSFSTRVDGCVIDGTCYAPGAANPAVACLRCLPASSSLAWTVAGNTCFLDGGCFSNGQSSPVNPCLSCAPPDGGTWAPASGRPCAAGDGCFEEALCDAGVCPPRPFRPDSNEPNNSPGSATAMGTATLCDSTQVQRTGIVSGPTDEDWYVASFNDTGACIFDPTAEFLTGGATVRACVFITCTGGTLSTVTCGGGSTSVTSPGRGCCETGPSPTFTYSFDCNCGSFCADDSATVRARVDGFATQTCANTLTRLKF